MTRPSTLRFEGERAKALEAIYVTPDVVAQREEVLLSLDPQPGEDAELRLERDDGALVVSVRDDGAGGADPDGGSGLRGMADRLAALGGRLEVDSPPGGGTLVRGVIPCAP